MKGDRDKYIKLFREEAREYIERLNNLLIEMEENSTSGEVISEAFRIFHTLKGMAASLGYKEIESISHDLEERLEGLKKYGKGVNKEIVDRIYKGMDNIEDLVEEIGRAEGEKGKEDITLKRSPWVKITLNKDTELPAASVAVIIKRIEQEENIEEIQPSFEEIKAGKIKDTFWVRCSNEKKVMEMLVSLNEVEEVSIERKKEESRVPKVGLGGIRVNVELLDRLQNIVGELVVFSSQLSTLLNDEDKKIKGFLDVHYRTLKELQNVVTEIRLVPLSLIFNKFPRYVGDLSVELGKEVSIDIFGSDIEVDRSLLEGISEPLIHLVRNAVGHGIETPGERKKLNKPTTGKVTVSAKRLRGDIMIEISDDGKGIDEKEVLSAALRKALVKKEEVDSLTRKEILHFLFIPGFTTDEKVSEVSGRGIGLDVVKQIVRSVGGSVDIKTEKNKGTTITMKMPLSMAIIRVYLFQSDGQLFALPMTFVDETLMIPGRFFSHLMGQEVMLLRKEILPVYHFKKIMKNHTDYRSKDTILSCLVVEVENERFALTVDKFRGSCDAVIKPLPEPLNAIKELTGITIIGDGEQCLIIDLPSFKYRRIYENTGS